MKFLVDVCAGRSIAEWLCSQGYNVAEVRKKDCRMSDEEILEWAVREKRVLVTMDGDFTELVIFFKKRHTGIVRLANLPIQTRLRYLKRILEGHSTELAGKAIIIQKGDKIRILHGTRPGKEWLNYLQVARCGEQTVIIVHSR